MISIIIPALNEEDQIGNVIRAVRKSFSGTEYEVIVADGGSRDATGEIAIRHGSRVIDCPEKGRANQMNFGAARAQGEILYFLHADTIPPEDAGALISNAVESGMDAGCFRLHFDDDHPALRFYSWFTRFNINLFRFGDQSLFIRRDLFRELSGFREDHLVMEDQEIIRRVRRTGNFRILDDQVFTSARKYRQNGYIRLQLIFALIVLMYYIGVSQKAIRHLYSTLVIK